MNRPKVVQMKILRAPRCFNADATSSTLSPEEGGMGRAIYIANVLGLDMGMFYKRRDYTRVVNGRNPIVAHEFLGTSVEGKDMIIMWLESICRSGSVRSRFLIN